jgi:hypothetical protein
MSIIARIFIATAVCPMLGGIAGQDLARTAGQAAHVATGTLARWEMMGLVGGGVAGLLYAVLTIYCVVACGERVRARIADPIVITLGSLGVAELLVHRGAVAPALASSLRGATIFAWLLGLLFVVLAVKYRPRPVVRPAYEAEPDEKPASLPDQNRCPEALSSAPARWDYEEDEDG